ncbi:P-loop containing nucleoside triphosphate hydrolase protein [Irpex lacteus]|nr:P-loop containing nucleoside triphosphate hydrolase protein [Irpex lacteus]
MASSAALTTTHLPRLRKELEQWRSKQPPAVPFSSPSQDILSRLALHGLQEEQGKDVIVAFRTRPPLEHEAEEKFQVSSVTEAPSAEEDINEHKPTDEAHKPEFCPGITLVSGEPGVFVAHVPGMKWSGPTLTHKKFESDLAFGPNVTNDEVYERTIVANDIIPLALAGGTACILAYGQTGTGKTYTTEALEYRVARDLYVAAEMAGEKLLKAERRTVIPTQDSTLDYKNGADIFEFNVTFLELLGKRASDLLEPVDGLAMDDQGNPIRKEIAVHEDKNGDVRPRLISRQAQSAEHLHQLITSALSYRRVSATARNATSSRSHALLNIRIKNKLLPFAEDGQLILVDLAGSERYEDSKRHNKQRMLESRDNNKSLMHLKECVRAKAKMAKEDGFVHIPWRANKLTMLLKPVFDVESRQPSKTMIIAHVSPHLQDSTHSVSTLSYASPFKTSPPKPRGPAPYNPTDPRTWNHEQTLKWLTEEFASRALTRREHQHKVKEAEACRSGQSVPSLDPHDPLELAVDVEKLCPKGMTAKHFGAMYTTQFVQRCLECSNMGGDMTPEVVKITSAEVMGSLSFLILRAKTKARTTIMRTRKHVALDIYGESPMGTIPGTDIPLPKQGTEAFQLYARYQPDQYELASQRDKSTWYEATNEAVIQARKDDTDIDFATMEVVMKLMEQFWDNQTPASAVV